MLAGQPFAVRPDMAGVALQSWGVVLALEGLDGGGPAAGAWPRSLFGLSACVKQHLVGAWAVSIGAGGAGVAAGPAGLGAVARVVAAGRGGGRG